MQKRLMQAWQQGEHQAGGSGLGLYICRSLVKQMQGTMELVSEPGKGTRVAIVLPLQHCTTPDDSAKPDSMTLPDFAGQCSILVVEDHAANRQMLTAQLARLGCHFETAEDGESALLLLEDENYYDIILLDCGLPGIDGYTTTRKIRMLEQQQNREAMIVVAISAQSSAQHLARCLESGMNDVLTKPIRLNTLAETLQKWCTPAGSQTVQMATHLPIGEDVWLALQDDTRKFIAYTEQQELSWMLHHIHRIKGVAQMYQIDNLAEYAASLEESLRAGLPREHWQAQTWGLMLNKLTTLS
ncbi:response regulator [Enterobacter asburiae]|uniref:response regulator n=1 Tax=Scandinavium sp. UTDF21-P1B TaxID=3446379 RepID=UPI00348405A8